MKSISENEIKKKMQDIIAHLWLLKGSGRTFLSVDQKQIGSVRSGV